MCICRRLRMWTWVLLAGVLLGPIAAVSAATIKLFDLLKPGATLTSYDGSVVFSEFSYTGTTNAPGPSDINIITHETVPQGFKVQGPFQVVNGEDLDALLEFDAHAVPIGGNGQLPTLRTFVAAELGMLLVDSFGPGSSVSILERLDLFPLVRPVGVESLFVVDTPLGGLLHSAVPLDDSPPGPVRIHVSKDIALVTGEPVPPPGGPGFTFAGMSVFYQNFPNVPEPTTGFMLLALGSTVLLRRR